MLACRKFKFWLLRKKAIRDHERKLTLKAEQVQQKKILADTWKMAHGTEPAPNPELLVAEP